MKTEDKIARRIVGIINDSDEPLEMKDIASSLPGESRTKILYRLRDLQGKGLIRGKMVGAGKGAWIWWRKDAFTKGES